MKITGREKTLIAVVGGAITSGLSATSAFVAPGSTAGHAITAVIAAMGYLATATGVYLVPNSEVGDAVTATGKAAGSVRDDLAPPPPFSDDEIASVLGSPASVVTADNAGRHEATATS